MRSKKRMQKKMAKEEHEKMKDVLISKNKAQRQKDDLSAIKDKDLFSVKVNKEGLKEKREALKKDRFKRKAPETTSKAEFYKVKKFQETLKRRVDHGDRGPTDDLWGSGPIEVSRKMQKASAFLVKQMPRVKAVILPEGGLSYNPSAKDHKVVISKVISEETKILDKQEKTHRTMNPDLYKTAD